MSRGSDTGELITPLVPYSHSAGSHQQVMSPTLRRGQGYCATTEQASPPPRKDGLQKVFAERFRFDANTCTYGRGSGRHRPARAIRTFRGNTTSVDHHSSESPFGLSGWQGICKGKEAGHMQVNNNFNNQAILVEVFCR